MENGELEKNGKMRVENGELEKQNGKLRVENGELKD